mgnify:CR=1 FL=1
MRKKKPFHDPAPDIHDFPGVPEGTFDLVNQYGTYKINPPPTRRICFLSSGRSCRSAGAPCVWERTIWRTCSGSLRGRRIRGRRICARP